MRRRKPTQCSSGPYLIGSASGGPWVASACLARPRTVAERAISPPTRVGGRSYIGRRELPISFISNYPLYSPAELRLNCCDEWTKEEPHAVTSPSEHPRHGRRRRGRSCPIRGHIGLRAGAG